MKVCAFNIGSLCDSLHVGSIVLAVLTVQCQRHNGTFWTCYLVSTVLGQVSVFEIPRFKKFSLGS